MPTTQDVNRCVHDDSDEELLLYYQQFIFNYDRISEVVGELGQTLSSHTRVREMLRVAQLRGY